MAQHTIYTRPVARTACACLAVALLAGVLAIRAGAGPTSNAIAAPIRLIAPMSIVRPTLDPVLPTGKGMWIWDPAQAEGGDVGAIVKRAKAAGLSHVYVRTGSSWQGFHGAAFLDQLLPVAHAAGLRVYGWDFPNFRDVAADVSRAAEAIRYTTPGGHQINGFVPDIETPAEGTVLTVENVVAYGNGLRGAAGAGYPLIACVPSPTPHRLATFPYAETVASFDAVAPMVYWFNREPDTDVAAAFDNLAALGKPVVPIGQAFDGSFAGGRVGPPPDELARFLDTAAEKGATAVSFWSWQHTSEESWAVIGSAPEWSP